MMGNRVFGDTGKGDWERLGTRMKIVISWAEKEFCLFIR
jgi:hypothetical protein